MSKLHSLAINDTGFAFDPVTGESYTLNEVGIRLVGLFRQDMDVPDVAKAISAEFSVEFEEVYRDVLEFKNRLQVFGLIGGVR